jgi:hypothetical protein
MGELVEANFFGGAREPWVSVLPRAERIALDFAEQEGEPPARVRRVFRDLEAGRFDALSRSDTFLVVDALGCYECRDEMLEQLHTALFNLWLLQLWANDLRTPEQIAAVRRER